MRRLARGKNLCHQRLRAPGTLQHPYASEGRQFYVRKGLQQRREGESVTTHVPWSDVCAVCVQNLDFVSVIEAHGLQVNMANHFDYAVHEKYVSMYNLETLNAPGPDCRVPDPDVFRPLNEPVGHSPVVEVGRWARLDVECATFGLNLCGMQRDLRAVVPPREVGEPVAEEGQRREGAQGEKLEKEWNPGFPSRVSARESRLVHRLGYR